MYVSRMTGNRTASQKDRILQEMFYVKSPAWETACFDANGGILDEKLSKN